MATRTWVRDSGWHYVSGDPPADGDSLYFNVTGEALVMGHKPINGRHVHQPQPFPNLTDKQIVGLSSTFGRPALQVCCGHDDNPGGARFCRHCGMNIERTPVWLKGAGWMFIVAVVVCIAWLAWYTMPK